MKQLSSFIWLTALSSSIFLSATALATASLATASLSSSADINSENIKSKNSGFTPYSAQYEAKSTEVPFDIDARRTLEIDTATGETILRSDAKAFMSHIQETSRLTSNSCEAKTQAYHYKRKVFGKKKYHSITFDWNQLTAHYQLQRSAEEPISLTDEVADRLQAHYRLRCAVRIGLKTAAFPVISKNQVKIHTYEMRPSAPLELPYGVIDAVEVRRIREDSDRRTSLWVAKSLDYLIVKIVQQEDGETNSLELTEFSFQTTVTP